MRSPWLRCRFKANADDYRPVKWPPPGPYWCSGHGDDYAILIAYVRQRSEIKEFWPEAKDLEDTQAMEIVYSDRFPKPEWFNLEGQSHD